jgi:outer membrane protein assembly factor BamB
MRNTGLRLGLAVALLLGWCAAAEAVITFLYPLKDALKGHEFIAVAKVDKLLPEKPAAVLTLIEDLKGKFPVRRLPINLSGDEYAKENNHVPQMLKRLAPDLPLVLFGNQRGGKVTVFGFTNGTWFQMEGRKTGKDTAVVFAFNHVEPYLRRTFKGTTAELRQIIVDGLSGKKQPPEPNEKEPPGFGPEVKPEGSKQKAEGSKGDLLPLPGMHRGPLFAVIPTVGLGAPLAILALLFPSVFGGVLVLFRQWLAFFTVFSVNTTLFLLHGWLAPSHWGTWWTSPSSLWLAMTFVALLGTLWAWRRNIRALHSGDWSTLEAPPRAEHFVLGFLSLSCLAVVLILSLSQEGPFASWWHLLLAFSIGIWLGTIIRLARSLLAASARYPKAHLPTEGIILVGLLGSLVWFSVARSGSFASVPDTVAAAEGRPVARLDKGKVRLTVFTENGTGVIVSSPLVVGDRIYVAVAHKKGFETFGVLYCLDRESRKILWTFDNDGDMKQAYSSPCVADGRVYIGEGFHDDQNCRVYCINADTGAKIWDFQTTSQTESTPCVADGRVFIGAGNDGLYCLDARKGKVLWRFPGKSARGGLLRFGANPVVSDDRVYIGTGVDRNRPDNPGETALFCLDAATGRQVWRTDVDLPCWGAAAVVTGRVFFCLGNGDVFNDAKAPAQPKGALLCLSPRTGKLRWRFDVPNGALERPVVDRYRVFFGARDGKLYCVSRLDGQKRWEASLGSPVIAAPALDCFSSGDKANTVYAIGARGRVMCLDAASGRTHWDYRNLQGDAAHLSSSPVLVTEATTDGERRRLYFGAALNAFTIPALYSLEDFMPE